MTSRKNKMLLLVSSLATLLLLIVGAYQENVGREWRRLQRDYRSRLGSPQAEDFQIQLRQVCEKSQMYAPPFGSTVKLSLGPSCAHTPQLPCSGWVNQEWVSNPFDDPEIDYRLHPGSLVPSDPTDEAFWDVFDHGSGPQTIEWTPEMGRWVLVIMNEDGSSGINVSGSLGADLPWLFWLGLGLVLMGIVALAGGAVMVYFAARSPKQPVTSMGAAP